ncbi:hypothetical protein MMC30_003054 [Trapelia coarctata]|nr:hypothetical protein [Trapelia coarctata]
MPDSEFANHSATGEVELAPQQGQAAVATNNHNPTTLVEASIYDSLVSIDRESGSQHVPSRRLRDRVKAALHLGNGRSEKTGSIFDETFDQKIRPIDSYPEGYPRVAAMEDSDPNFMICRKFGWLHLRVLLHYQDQLVELEEDLERIDAFDAGSDFRKLKSRRRDEAINSERKDILIRIDKKLAAYDELLLRLQTIHAIKRPTKRNQTSMYNFLHNTRSLAESEAEWVRRGEDLAALSADQEYGWFNGVVEDTMIKISRTATMLLFRTKEQCVKSGDELVNLLSPKRFNAFVTGFMTVMATALLLIPVSILYEVHLSGIQQVLVIFAFTLTFAMSFSIFTKARRHEAFLATAAYCAVLVVFLGNSLPRPPSTPSTP